MTTASPDRPERIFASVEVNEVAFAFEFPALPERLWAALTSPAKLAAWFPADLRPRIGHRFTLRPDPRTGLAGPTVGEVVAVDEPHRLVLRLFQPDGPATLTWLVEPARGGSRLRVTRSGPLGDPAELSRAYRHLFGERLGAVLRGGLLAKVARRPPSAITQPGLIGPDLADDTTEPLAPSPAAGEAVANSSPSVGPTGGTFSTQPPPASEPADDPSERVEWLPVRQRVAADDHPQSTEVRRRRPLVPIVVAVAIVLGLFAFAQTRSLTPDSAAGVGSSPTGSPAQTAPAGTDRGVPAAGPGAVGGTYPGTAGPPHLGPSGGSSGGSPGASAPPPPGLVPPLIVTYQVSRPTLLSYPVTVTLTNPASSPQRWSNVMVRFSGVNLAVSGVGSSVTYRPLLPDGCFRPGPTIDQVPAGGTVSFGFTVSAVDGTLLADVAGVDLNQAACAN